MTADRLTVLIADDEPHLVNALRQVLEAEGHAVLTAADGREACDLIAHDQPQLVLTDLVMPGTGGLEILAAARASSPGTRVILMTAYATAETAVEALRRGAADYLIKPVPLDEVRLRVRRVAEELFLSRDNLRLRDALARRQPEPEIIGADPALGEALALARRVAASTALVLIRGETGTGKELVARLIHRASPRAAGAFLAINCGALSESLLERELFGHERGAFTGADAARPGLLEAAADGTLLLDEVGEMSPTLQVKLLRVLEAQPFQRVGGTRPIQCQARFLAATHQDLAAAVAAGRFRADLWYRLNVVTVALPPLRDRGDDVDRLADHLLPAIARARGLAKLRLSPGARAALRAHRWPGNVRELHHALERAAFLSADGALEATHLGLGGIVAGPAAPDLAGLPYREARDAFEREYLRKVLEVAGGNVTRAAERIGLDRRNLQIKLRRLGLRPAE